MKPLRCVGCGMEFSSAEAFDLHATGKRRAAVGTPRRCRSEAEMRALGMYRKEGGDHGWILRPPPAKA
jgi:hypothetical protein